MAKSRRESTPATEPLKAKVFIVDDHPMVRDWLGQLIHAQSDLVMCGEAENARGALDLIPRVKPDVVIADLSLHQSHGIDLIKDLKIRFRKLPVLVLSMHEESVFAEHALRAGARGYISKHETGVKILAAIRQVLRGELYMSEQTAARLAGKAIEGPLRKGGSRVDFLSDRELQVLELIGSGHEARQIASMLHLDLKTVNTYRFRIRKKLKLTSHTQLIHYAVRWAGTGTKG